jgi:hypothetical protein
MLARALTELVDDPVLAWSWFVADSGYGRDPGLRAFCHQQAAPYVLAVPCDLPLVDVRGAASRVDALLAETDPGVWQQPSAGAGSKGHRCYDWAARAATVKRPTTRARVRPHPADPPGDHAEGHRHVTISMLAHAFLAIRVGLGKKPEPRPTDDGPHTPTR